MDKTKKQEFEKLCSLFRLPKPIYEYQFAKDEDRKWRADVFFRTDNRKVILEIEGGVWTQGRHTRGSGFVKDMVKYNNMAKRGILLLRVVPKNLLKRETFELLKETIYGL